MSILDHYCFTGLGVIIRFGAKIMKRCFLVVTVVLALSALVCSGQVYAATDTQGQKLSSAHDVNPVWVVVNLFTGRTSKQAVIVQETLERLGAEGRGIVLPYADITVENMERIRPAFLALSPNGIPWCKYRGKNGEDLKNFFAALRTIIEDMRIPVIGICGGHQALALAFGGKVGPIRGGEDDCLPYGNNPTERGRHNMEIVRHDPLFLGMSKTLNLVQSHYDEVKRLPPGFLLLAENKLSPYQIIRHPDRPAYGVQAHTEYYLNSRPDGGILLRNFLNIARIHNRFTRNPGPNDTESSRQAQLAPRDSNPLPW